MTYVVSYISSAIVFFGLDFVWLAYVSPAFYRSRIGDLLLAQPNFTAAGAFYLLYVAGIVYFAVIPALQGGSWTTALVSGAFLGLIAYGTYDMTNLATLKNWSVSVSVVDMLWGTFLTGFSALAAYLATAQLLSRNMP